MVGLAEQLIGSRHQVVSLSLHSRPATLLDFCRALGQPGEKAIDLFAHLGRCAQAGIDCHFLTSPVPDRLIRIKVTSIDSTSPVSRHTPE